MRAVRAFLFRLMNLTNLGRMDRELAEELESHLGMQIEDNLRATVLYLQSESKLLSEGDPKTD